MTTQVRSLVMVSRAEPPVRWVATVEGSVVGMMVLGGEDLDQLYLAPAWQGQGIGGRLVHLAKQLRPAGLALWTFQVNVSARRFYERHGFVAAECTDGHRNEAGLGAVADLGFVGLDDQPRDDLVVATVASPLGTTDSPPRSMRRTACSTVNAPPSSTDLPPSSPGAS